jgi:hypothetical protein
VTGANSGRHVLRGGLALLTIAALNSCGGPRPGAETGLVVAYGSAPGGDVGGAERYETLALVIAPDTATLVGSAPDILVPGDAGFDRIGIVVRCAYDRDTRVWNYRQEVRRADARATFPRDPDGCLTPQGDERHDRARTCDDNRALVLFVGPRVWSERLLFQQTDECEPRGGRYSMRDVVLVPGDTTPLPLGAFVDSAAADSAYARAMSDGFRELVKDGLNCPEQSAPFDLSSWSIQHRDGAWTAFAIVSEFAIYGECQYEHPMALSLPDSVTGGATGPRNAPYLAATVPDAQDWFASPDGRYALVTAGRPGSMTLRLFSLVHRALGRLLWERAWEGQNAVVLIRWGDARLVRDRLPLPSPAR